MQDYKEEIIAWLKIMRFGDQERIERMNIKQVILDLYIYIAH